MCDDISEQEDCIQPHSNRRRVRKPQLVVADESSSTPHPPIDAADAPCREGKGPPRVYGVDEGEGHAAAAAAAAACSTETSTRPHRAADSDDDNEDDDDDDDDEDDDSNDAASLRKVPLHDNMLRVHYNEGYSAGVKDGVDAGMQQGVEQGYLHGYLESISSTAAAGTTPHDSSSSDGSSSSSNHNDDSNSSWRSVIDGNALVRRTYLQVLHKLRSNMTMMTGDEGGEMKGEHACTSSDNSRDIPSRQVTTETSTHDEIESMLEFKTRIESLISEMESLRHQSSPPEDDDNDDNDMG